MVLNFSGIYEQLLISTGARHLNTKNLIARDIAICGNIYPYAILKETEFKSSLNGGGDLRFQVLVVQAAGDRLYGVATEGRVEIVRGEQLIWISVVPHLRPSQSKFSVREGLCSIKDAQIAKDEASANRGVEIRIFAFRERRTPIVTKRPLYVHQVLVSNNCCSVRAHQLPLFKEVSD